MHIEASSPQILSVCLFRRL